MHGYKLRIVVMLNLFQHLDNKGCIKTMVDRSWNTLVFFSTIATASCTPLSWIFGSTQPFISFGCCTYGLCPTENPFVVGIAIVTSSFTLRKIRSSGWHVERFVIFCARYKLTYIRHIIYNQGQPVKVVLFFDYIIGFYGANVPFCTLPLNYIFYPFLIPFSYLTSKTYAFE